MTSSPPADRLRDEIGRLTEAPADGFVAARDARVKELRADGDRELATALGGARRPTVPAWTLDQLGHRHGDQLDELSAAADALRAAQSASTPDRDAVREATRAFTAQVRVLRALAADTLRAAGTRPDPHLDEVEATLLAAATDAEVAADLRAGALLRPVPSPGFAAFASLAPPARTTGRQVSRSASDGDRGDDAERSSNEDREARERAARVDELRRRHEELTAERDDLAAHAERASADATAARDEAADLRARADDADAIATSAEAECDDLRTRLDRLGDELDAVATELDDG